MIFASFATPLLIWCIFAYTPGLWDVSRKIHITTDLKGGEYPTIYRTGHLMEGERFAGFQSLVREANEGIRAYRDGGGDLPEGISVSSRSNSKVLRKLHRVAVLEKWMTEEQSTDNEAFYEVWKGLAEGELAAQPNLVSAENLEIIRANWDILKAGGETYNSETFPSEPLYHLLPDGVKSIGRPSYLPAPHEVFVSAWKLFTGSSTRVDSLMGFRYLDSLKIVFLGFFFGCLIGLPVGLLAGTFDFFSKYFEPFVDFFRYMPAPAFGTLMVFLLGSHDAPKVALVFLGTVCQAILMTANTTRQLDKGLLDAAQTLGARKINLVFEVVVPGIVHNLYNDLRILLGWAWTWLVIAELMGVKSGLTEIIDTHGRRFNFDIVYAIILLIGLTGFVTDQFLSWLRPKLFPWAEENQKSGSFFSSFSGISNLFKRSEEKAPVAIKAASAAQTAD